MFRPVTSLVLVTPRIVLLLSGSGNGHIHIFNGGRHSVQIFPSQQRKSWQHILKLDQGCLKDLGWWQTALKSWNGCAFCPKSIEVQLTTDASSVGWGGFIPGRQAQGLWTNSFYYDNSNLREMAAVLFSMIAFRKDLQGKVVQILSDNIATVANINFQGGPSASLTEMAALIWSEALKNKMQLTAKFLAGVQNTHADFLSRRIVPTAKYFYI